MEDASLGVAVLDVEVVEVGAELWDLVEAREVVDEVEVALRGVVEGQRDVAVGIVRFCSWVRPGSLNHQSLMGGCGRGGVWHGVG